MPFPVTQWTVLAQATLHGDEAGREALNRLCQTYWEPVRQSVLRRGWTPHEAEDLTQSFFMHLLERGLLRRADRERGRFRAFLKTILHRFLLHELERRGAARRGGGRAEVDVGCVAEQLALDPETDVEFDRRWARAAMQAALDRVLEECVDRRQRDAAGVIAPFLGGSGELPTYEVAAARLGLGLAAFKTEVLHWRRRLREQLRAEVRRTIATPHEFEEEFNYLRQLLAG